MSLKEFSKVIGYEDVKIELERIVDQIRNKEKYEKLGVNLTRGLLMDGKPGLGKTLMAKCFIKACNIPTFYVRKEKTNGDFVKYIVDTFEKAKEKTPSIVFLDDLDKFANNDMGHQNADEFVAIQSCIDDCKGLDVFVLATTNDIRAIPKSLLRPGRFDKKIDFTAPNKEDAIKIVDYYLKKKKCTSVNAKDIALLLSGASCALLETVINEGGVYAGFENRDHLEMKDLIRSYLRVAYNAPETIIKKDDNYAIRTAYHEAGHALVGELLEKGSINLLTIKKHERSDTRGFAGFINNDDYFKDVKFMENRVISCLGGKAATEIVYGENDPGVNSDLHRAFDITKRFIDEYCSYGFSYWEGISDDHESPSSNDCKLRKEIATELKLEEFYQKAKKLIIDNRDKLDKLANELLKKEILVSSDITAIVHGNA